jgi:hypothetical protein
MTGIGFSYGDFGLSPGKKKTADVLLISVPYDRRPSSIRTVNEFSDCTMMKQFTRR